MNAIAVLRFIFIFMFAGVMFFMFDSIMTLYILPVFPAAQTGPYYWLIYAMWNGIPLVVAFREAITLLISYQKGRPIE